MITVTTFPQSDSPKMSNNRDYHGWPNGGESGAQSDDAWQDQCHWHGEDYNPYIEFKTFSDGTRHVNDCLVGTYSKSLYNGNMEAHVQDGHISTVVNQRVQFTGDSHMVATGLNTDETTGGHGRENDGVDHYHHVNGVTHSHAGGGAVSTNPGNQVHAHGGTVAHMATSDNASIGFGQGGQGQQARNMMGMSKMAMNIVASKDANINLHTEQGKKMYMQAGQGDITHNATGGMHTVNAKQAFVNGSSGTQIHGPGTDGSMQIPNFKVMGGATFQQGFKVAGMGGQWSSTTKGGDQSKFSPSGGGGGGSGGGGAGGSGGSGTG